METFLAPLVSLPFDDAAAKRYAVIRHALERKGLVIGAYDMQILEAACSRSSHPELPSCGQREEEQ